MRATVHTIPYPAITDEYGHSPAYDLHEVRLCGVWVHESPDRAEADRRARTINEQIDFLRALSVSSAPLLTSLQQAD